MEIRVGQGRLGNLALFYIAKRTTGDCKGVKLAISEKNFWRLRIPKFIFPSILTLIENEQISHQTHSKRAYLHLHNLRINDLDVHEILGHLKLIVSKRGGAESFAQIFKSKLFECINATRYRHVVC